MLTLKQIEVRGHENLYPAAKIMYQPRLKTADGYSGACVFIETAKGDVVCIGAFGRYYAMNEAGRTVATYDLGGWPEPSTDDPAPPHATKSDVALAA